MSANQSFPIKHTAQTTPASPKALVVGEGIPALVAAQSLTEMGVEVTFARLGGSPSQLCLALPDPDPDRELHERSLDLKGVEVIDADRALVISRDGSGFKALFENGTALFFDCLLLAPGISLTLKQSTLPENTEIFTSRIDIRPSARVSFLMDYEYPSDPALGTMAIKAAADNVDNGGASLVCFRNVPVPHLFGETLYDRARNVGVQFVRFAAELPAVISLDDMESTARFRLAVRDAIDPEAQLVFECDRVFVVTGPDASSTPEWAVRMLTRGDRDDRGFVLSESVHCSSGEAFAGGVFVLGEATGNLDLIRAIAQAKATAVKAQAWMKISRVKEENQPISINSSCVGCLTCYRVCPHQALSVKPGASRSPIVPLPSLCRECGICASVCPSAAIKLTACPDDSALAFIKGVPQADRVRSTFVFGCQRSAGVLAPKVRMPEDVRFLPVPCAGRVSEYVIWAALAAGAKGVLVVGCHHGNCASHNGTDWAAARIRGGLESGLFQQGTPRLGYQTIAPNEAARFERILREFAAGTQSGPCGEPSRGRKGSERGD